MSKRYSGKSFKDSSTAKKPKLSLIELVNENVNRSHSFKNSKRAVFTALFF